jgi:hypothetical protein
VGKNTRLNKLKNKDYIMDLRDDFIARVVRGRSFVDVGGLWGTVNEKVSVAARCEARTLTMVDIAPAGNDLWVAFTERLASLGIGGCGCISSDVCALVANGIAPEFEVVHCSGVLYHHPNPIWFLETLRRIATKHLVLTSAVTQESVSNDLGTYHIPLSGVIFVPALDQRERSILSKYWVEKAGVGGCTGITEPVRWNTRDFGPWWWLPTPRAMLAMAECVGFRVLDSGPTWNGNAYTALLEVVA